MIPETEIDAIFGKRRAPTIPTKSAEVDLNRLNDLSDKFLKSLRTIAADEPMSEQLVREIAVRLVAIRALIPVHDRVGLPAGQSRLADMEATIRLATEMPDQFNAFDVPGLKKRAIEMRKGGAT